MAGLTPRRPAPTPGGAADQAWFWTELAADLGNRRNDVLWAKSSVKQRL